MPGLKNSFYGQQTRTPNKLLLEKMDFNVNEFKGIKFFDSRELENIKLFDNFMVLLNKVLKELEV